ncbi:MAG: sigma-70 family RNA polymerase sigma factor [Clostridia bacterium]|nr:sigma-70 family RNA polymerase sigma factor [Clostridia bacterium]
MEDSIITGLIAERNEAGLQAAREKYGKYVETVVGNVLSDVSDAEECVNDVFLGAWDAVPRALPSNLKFFLAKLAREKAIDRLRSNSAQKRGGKVSFVPEEELDKALSGSVVSDRIESAELTELITNFLRGLEGQERNVFIRRYWYFDAIEDIAQRYGFGKSKVKMMLKRMRDRLAAYLKKEGY